MLFLSSAGSPGSEASRCGAIAWFDDDNSFGRGMAFVVSLFRYDWAWEVCVAVMSSVAHPAGYLMAKREERVGTDEDTCGESIGGC